MEKESKLHSQNTQIPGFGHAPSSWWAVLADKIWLNFMGRCESYREMVPFSRLSPVFYFFQRNYRVDESIGGGI